VATAVAGPLGRARVGIAAGVFTVIATVVVGAGLASDARRIAATGLFDVMANTAFFPQGAAAFLDLNRLPARLFDLYVWSGYVMFAAPERRVFIDGRAHMVYPGTLWHESYGVEMGRPGWEDVLDRYGVSLVLWPATPDAGWKPLHDGLVASPQWVTVYDDGHAVVFAHVERGKAWVDAYQSLALRYPDVPDAQLFAGETMLRMGAFERARSHFQAALVRHPSLRGVLRDTLLVRIGERAHETDRSGDWFQVAFLHDVLDDRDEAAAVYHRVASTGIDEPMASFVAAALVRLRGDGAAD